MRILFVPTISSVHVFASGRLHNRSRQMLVILWLMLHRCSKLFFSLFAYDYGVRIDTARKDYFFKSYLFAHRNRGEGAIL